MKTEEEVTIQVEKLRKLCDGIKTTKDQWWERIFHEIEEIPDNWKNINKRINEYEVLEGSYLIASAISTPTMKRFLVETNVIEEVGRFSGDFQKTELGQALVKCFKNLAGNNRKIYRLNKERSDDIRVWLARDPRPDMVVRKGKIVPRDKTQFIEYYDDWRSAKLLVHA